jgi:hypothetical protein
MPTWNARDSCQQFVQVEHLRDATQTHRLYTLFPVSISFQLRNPKNIKKAAISCVFEIYTYSFPSFGRKVRFASSAPSAESAIEFGRRLQHHQITGLRNRGSSDFTRDLP